MDRIPPTGAERYSYLQSVCENHNMQNFSDFLKWYNNKDVVPTLEAMQKMIEFYHNKGIDTLKLGYTLPNLANTCLNKSRDSKFYPFTESDKDLLEKIREYTVGGPPIVFTRKAVVDETFLCKPSNLCNSIVGIDASQLYPYWMCQPMPTGFYTRWEYDSETKRFTARQNKSRSCENMVLSYFQQSRPDCRIENIVTTGRQKKIDCFSVDGICYHCITVFEAIGCWYHYCPCQEARPSRKDTDIERRMKKRKQDGNTYNKSVTKLLKCGSEIGGVFLKLMHQSKFTSEKTFPTNVRWVKNKPFKELSMGDSLGVFNVILKFPNICEVISQTFLHYSKTP